MKELFSHGNITKAQCWWVKKHQLQNVIELQNICVCVFLNHMPMRKRKQERERETEINLQYMTTQTGRPHKSLFAGGSEERVTMELVRKTNFQISVMFKFCYFKKRNI